MQTEQSQRPRLELLNISCERDGRLLFDGLSQSVQPGDILQVLGPNGSGKTTLLRVLTGISSDFSGQLRWCGDELARQRLDYLNSLLYLGHLPAIKRALTPEENLRWYCGLSAPRSPAQISAALTEVGLMGYEDVACYRLSAGQLRRVALARLYLTSAQVWILDEPFTAIDYEGVDKLRALFVAHSRRGGIIIITTHQDLGIEQVKMLNLLDYAGRPE